MNEDVTTRAKRILSANRYMVLATIQAGIPWSTPVFYAYDEERKQLTTQEDFIGDAPIRFYKFIPAKMYFSNEATKWNGKWIDSRSEVNSMR